ncbi:MAG: hypothetical protein NTW16_16675 [Bacteroidetes bacterium]|nr:hypothetical protein [Bacteroidota bacterium]
MKNLIAAYLLFFLSASFTMAQVGINTALLPPDPSAGLDITFTDKGLLPPRVELIAPYSANPVVSPVTGLLVYNTSTAGNPPDNVVPGYYYWDGNRWNPFVASVGTSGQTLRNDAGIWMAGSTLYNDGTNIGIGLINPTHKLTVAGTNETFRLIGPGNFGSAARLNFGDGNYVCISEDWDDKLLIHSAGRTAITGGRVGIGTTAPGQPLTVAGTIQTTSGGIMFPDNTIQATAAAVNNIHFIGEPYGGGKVFYTWDGGQHGLIVDTSYTISFVSWNDGGYTTTNAVRDNVYAGQFNTERIILNRGTGGNAAQICAGYQGGGYGDWYMPSKYELNLLFQEKSVLSWISTGGYWSSTEFSAEYAWMQYFTSGLQGFTAKFNTLCVVPIRSF